MQISWTIEGQTQLSRVLQGVELEMKDWRAPLERAAKSLTKTFKTDVFKTEGAAIGEKWERLSPVTVARKARSGGLSQRPLVRTGQMKNKFRYTASDTEAVIHNPTPYFKYHQSSEPRSKLPRRVMMKIGHQQRQVVVKEFQKEWLRKLGKHV